MRHLNTTCIAAVLCLAWSSVALADITEDEARVIAEEGLRYVLEDDTVSLESAKSFVRDEPNGRRLVRFRLTPDGPSCYVDLISGVFAGCVLPCLAEGERPPAATEKEALEHTRRIAERFLGDHAAELEWHAYESDGMWYVSGRGPDLGDPPRVGRRYRAGATLPQEAGGMWAYRIRVPADVQLDPEITAEEAKEIALRELDSENGWVTSEPGLRQDYMVLLWHVSVTDIPKDEYTGDYVRGKSRVTYAINAMTGEVFDCMSTDPAGSAPIPEDRGAGTGGQESPARAHTSAGSGWAPATQRTRSASAMPLPLLSIGAALLAAGVGVVLLRRRR